MKNHRYLLAILLAAPLSNPFAIGASETEPLALTQPVTFKGVGPVRVGMSLEDLRREVGPVELEDKSGEMSCNFAHLPGHRWGLSWMLIEGRVVRTDVDGHDFATASGARVGDSEARLLSLYKNRVTVGPHTYVEKGHYLIVESPDRKSLLVFETDGSRVTSYRIGRSPEAGFIEGCS
jgi:hypothetical protein